MTREELAALSKEQLVDIVLRQAETMRLLLEQNALLAKRIEELEAELARLKPPPGKSTPDWVKQNKPKSKPKPSAKKGHRGYGRKCEEPTRSIEHVSSACPDCGTELKGGWVKRRRQVLHIPVPKVEVIEHVIYARRCSECHKDVVPTIDLSAEVLGRHRVSVDTMSLIATLSEVGRVPIELLQQLLSGLYGLKLSLGELVEILKTVAKRGEPVVEKLKEELRASPVVHADETGMRENGQNGYIWTFSTPDLRYFQFSLSRSGNMVSMVLGDLFEGTLVTDFYAAYNRMLGLHQRCWAHLLRAVHELKERYPDDKALKKWASRLYRLYCKAKAFRSDDSSTRTRAQHMFEAKLSRICQPFVKSDSPQRTLCERMERYLTELFTFVADPRVPSDNNAAERSLRSLVVDRKISGGTRSCEGSRTKMTLASLFGTWAVRSMNPFHACRNLLISPLV